MFNLKLVVVKRMGYPRTLLEAIADGYVLSDVIGEGKDAVQIEDGSTEYVKDQTAGYTHPNLHRRINPVLDPAQVENEELSAREYKLRIVGKDSLRTTSVTVHDDTPFFEHKYEIP
jgi:hypothetical protein